MDFDYLDKLSDSEKQWLSNFMEEYVSGNFTHKGKIMHRTKKEKRECYSRNNSRNRDALSISNATGRSVYSGDGAVIQAVMDANATTRADSVENTLIDVIDLENAGVTLETLDVIFDDERLKKKRKKLKKRNNRRRAKKKLPRSDKLVSRRLKRANSRR
jgi:hypothetical protein